MNRVIDLTSYDQLARSLCVAETKIAEMVAVAAQLSERQSEADARATAAELVLAAAFQVFCDQGALPEQAWGSIHQSLAANVPLLPRRIKAAVNTLQTVYLATNDPLERRSQLRVVPSVGNREAAND